MAFLVEHNGNYMKKIIITLLICLNLVACTNFFRPYRPPIQQGNILTDNALAQVRLGMTKQSVVKLLGEPVLTNPFTPDTWFYVYTYLPSKGRLQKKRLVIYFRNNVVVSYTGDIPIPRRN